MVELCTALFTYTFLTVIILCQKRLFLCRSLFGIEECGMTIDMNRKNNYTSVHFLTCPFFSNQMSELLTHILPKTTSKSSEVSQLVTVLHPILNKLY